MVWLAVSGMTAVALAASSSLGQATSDDSLIRGLEWRNVSNNMGGRAVTAVGVRSNPHLYYAGYAGGGLWKTEDGGRSWHNISDGFFDSGSIGDIAVYNQDPSIIHAGAGEAPARGEMSTFGDGMYKSIDAGRTWKHIGLKDTKQIARVLIDPKDPNRVYVAAQGDQWGPNDERGVYRSAGGGVTWKRVLFVSDIAGASDLAMDPNNPRVLYAGFWDHQRTPWDFRTIGPGSGLWKSADGGDTWMQLQWGLPRLMGKVRIAVTPSKRGCTYEI